MSIADILAKHQLTDTGLLLNYRNHVHQVIGPDGQVMILKTDRIEPYQVRLLLAATLHQYERRFATQRLFYPSEQLEQPEYLLLEYIEGDELKSMYETNLPQALAISRAICIDYQTLIKECQTRNIIPGNFDSKQARGWMDRVFYDWIQKIMERQLLTDEEALKISSMLFQLADQDPHGFFGLSHGNIHGEHVIINKKGTPYLLDMTVEPRPGGAMYDRLRVLDFALLKHPDPERALPHIVQELNELKSTYDPKIVQAVWALRCIGLLGKDILDTPKKATAPDYPIREKIALAMIRGQY